MHGIILEQRALPELQLKIRTHLNLIFFVQAVVQWDYKYVKEKKKEICNLLLPGIQNHHGSSQADAYAAAQMKNCYFKDFPLSHLEEVMQTCREIL